MAHHRDGRAAALILVLIAIGVAQLIGAGSASAKGRIERIGISGPGWRGEVRVNADGLDFGTWVPHGPMRTGVFYSLVYYARFGGGPLERTSPLRYYPASGGLAAVIVVGPHNWYSVPLSLKSRLDAAIAAARAGRSTRFLDGEPAIITSWPKAVADAIIIVLLVGAVMIVRRRGLRLGSRPAPEGHA